MRKILVLLIIFLNISCDRLDENTIIEKREPLNELVTKLKEYRTGTYDRDDIDEFLIDDVRELNIDLVIKNGSDINFEYSGFVEENDSLIILVNKAGSILKEEKRIIYDYKTKPRNFGNDTITGASYIIKQFDDRWYYSEIGFD